MTAINFSEMAKRWQSPYISRQEIGAFTGGILNPKTLANLDSQGKGPKGRVRVGRKVAYCVDELILWMEQRAEVLR